MLKTGVIIFAIMIGLLTLTIINHPKQFPATIKSTIITNNFQTTEEPSPKDRIEEKDIKLSKNEVTIRVHNAFIARFADTNSMDPVIDEKSNAIEIPPESPEDIEVGDIIAYYSSKNNKIVIHRVIKKEKDQEGTYYIVKGDNNPKPDEEKVRYNQVMGIVVGILY